MTLSLYFEILGIMALGIIFVESVVNRICKCVEQVATVKQYGKIIEKDKDGNKTIPSSKESS